MEAEMAKTLNRTELIARAQAAGIKVDLRWSDDKIKEVMRERGLDADAAPEGLHLRPSTRKS
jgi:hypothetical protein